MTEHEPSGTPNSLLLSENHDTIVTMNIYLSFSAEMGSFFRSSLAEFSRFMQS